MSREFALIDTNVVSCPFRRDSRAELHRRIMEPYPIRRISFQTLAELEFWASANSWGRRRRAGLAYFLEPCEVVHTDDQVCQIWARLRAQRERAGRRIHPEDAWIAATATSLRCPLITHDPRDFAEVDALQVLSATMDGR